MEQHVAARDAERRFHTAADFSFCSRNPENLIMGGSAELRLEPSTGGTPFAVTVGTVRSSTAAVSSIVMPAK